VVQRRWWLPVLLTLLTAVLSVLTSPLTQGGHSATVRFLLGVPAEAPRGAYFTYDKYYSLLSTEYLTDDFVEVVRSKGFLEDVKSEAAPDSGDLTITSLPRSERAPRVLSVTVNGGSEAAVLRAAGAIADIVVNRSAVYFPSLGERGVAARIIDPPAVTSAAAGGRALLNVGLRTGLGLAIGLALAALLHYLDTTLYNARDVRDSLRLPLLGELPDFGGGR
jgi:capsular polysaccharide biosynthesis protein